MIEGIIFMLGLGIVCAAILTAASRIFYVYEDPRIAEVEACFAGANCGGCGYTGCSAAAVAVVAGQAEPNVCIVGGPESAAKAAEVMGVEVGLAESPKSYNPCSGGLRAENKFVYLGVNTCRAQATLSGGQRTCSVGCIGLGDCIEACQFNALKMGPEGYPVVVEENCVGCGACEKVCPKYVMKVKTMSERLMHFNCSDDRLAPCRQTCPAEIDIPLYIAQIREGDYEGAVKTIRERNPFLLACGRVCPHPCETNCRRGIEDEPVSINQLKRFVADYEMNSEERLPVPMAPQTRKRIAVIGGGPAGLTCAYFLRRLGHQVNIFEAMPKLGGMLRYGIPQYRLPKEVLDWEIQGILDLGIDFHTNVRFGHDFDLSSLVASGFDAIFLGIGAWKDASLRVKGEDLKGCYTGIDFLSRLAAGETIPIGHTAAIIGGGNTAIDCSRNLIRLGAQKVYIVYRRTRAEMPANAVEIDAAEHEGVQFFFLAAPVEVKGDEDGTVTHLEYLKMELGEPDASGRRRPVPIEGSEALLETDMVITAIGQSPDISFSERSRKRLAELKTTRWNTIDVDPATLQSNIPYLFSAGDAATGPSLVVDAIGGGRRAARSIHQYVMGQEITTQPEELGKDLIPETIFDHVDGVVKNPRAPMPELPIEERIYSFVEVDQVLTENSARSESNRCLSCCLTCYDKDPVSVKTSKAKDKKPESEVA
ncbi:MAG: FAD-dependent oxidoreductase [Desulfobacterales bacterium]|jgi:NADPH-dependent glutamate synthase beta subunit-like oxidoreductase|nr:FAD-dependent oxidoreductase [Deltaproteobacteria bacterium]